MRIVITRLLTLSAENVTEEVIWALAAIYLCLVCVTLTSVFSLRSSVLAKLAWALLILGIPVIGMVFYCFRCLAVADYSFLKQFGLVPASKGNRAKV